MRKEAVWVTRRLSFCLELPHRGCSAGLPACTYRQRGGRVVDPVGMKNGYSKIWGIEAQTARRQSRKLQKQCT